jgi:hypothetical protein
VRTDRKGKQPLHPFGPKVQFPTIIHVLNHPELQEYFKHFDRLANTAKARSRQWGAAAIIMGAIAIALAATEIILQSYNKELNTAAGSLVNVLLWTIAIVAALSGIGSVVIGIPKHRAIDTLTGTANTDNDTARYVWMPNG